MATASRLQIPEYYHKGISSFVSLDEDTYSSLEKSLEQSVPSLSRTGLVAHLAQKVPIDKDSLEAIVQFLLSLYPARPAREVDIPDFVADVVRAIQATKKPELEPKEKDWEGLKTRLGRLLSLEQSLGVTSKAFGVMSEHGHVFLRARLITDIRPVFLSGVIQEPNAAVIIHNLKIEYRKNNETIEFFVALDSDDVLELRNSLDRADEKARVLKDILKTTAMQYLEP